MQRSVNNSLVQYIEHEILPRYEHYDAAHQRDHIDAVITRSLELAKHYDVNVDMVYAIAAYHDTGICEGRETHHLVSGRIIRDDIKLRNWFTENQIETMAQAAEDHRASSTHEPRSIYGKIVAEADRLIVPETVIRRTIQYGLNHHPDYDKEGQYLRFKKHMLEKYSDNGYLRLWLPESDNAPRLEELRTIIRDEARMRQTFDKEFDRLVDSKQ